MVVGDEDVRPIIEILRKSARTGKFGDGKIFVYPVEIVAAIRNDDEIVSE
jgi:nitrogen regulatory protein P-II 1